MWFPITNGIVILLGIFAIFLIVRNMSKEED